MLVVADASALLALVACEGLDLLEELFGEVRVPPAVFAEVTVEGQPGAPRLRSYLAGKVVAVDMGQHGIRSAELGRGELEAIALYRQLRADQLLVDDRRARKAAVKVGIEVVGSAGVLVLAKQRMLIPAVKPLLHRMREAGIYLDARVEAQVLRAGGEE